MLAAAPLCAAAVPGELADGINAYNVRDYHSAIVHLKAVGIPQLTDYITYYLASSAQQTGDYDGALAALAAYRAEPVAASPLAGKISLLQARVLLDKRDPSASAEALKILQTDYKLLPEPDGDFALALAYEAQGEKPQSALGYERVYYSYPNTDLAAQSWTAMERLRTAMGPDFPQPTDRQKLERCERWVAAKEYNQARVEYRTLADSLTGVEKEDARTGIGAVDFLAGNAAAAFRYLKALHLPHSEADASRLYYLAESARRMNDDDSVLEAVMELGEHYPKSPWRLKALVAAGNHFLAANRSDRYVPLFKAASDTFPSDNATAYSHWKVVWGAYLEGSPERMEMFREHVGRYPGDSSASSALYFLGRLAEAAGKPAEARAYYDRLSAQYPHYFYGVLARERLKDAKVAAASPDPDVSAWLSGIPWPAHRDLSADTPNAATRQRIERARLLIAAGLPDLAESDLRFGARTDGEQPQLLALELAGAAPTPFQALRVMKSFSADYLSVPTEAASPRFWRMLFPLPYHDEVFHNARERGLDPYYVAALIRQESEFNPGAKSHANAYGLMQLIPSTGRMVGRQEGIKSVPLGMLLNPGLNIQLGTRYLRGQLDTWSGDWYQTLAAYNAGPGRVRQWISWTNYREPAEFVENIPFNETREYVQAVLRNADMYRELYEGKGAVSDPPDPASVLSKAVPAGKPVVVAARQKTRKPVAGRRAIQKKTDPIIRANTGY